MRPSYCTDEMLAYLDGLYEQMKTHGGKNASLLVGGMVYPFYLAHVGQFLTDEKLESTQRALTPDQAFMVVAYWSTLDKA